uniref:Uncharacterized protein n=1 Tax=Plectus sambesii TaxID=2011161 RepID=A0A914W5X5_9BILA
MSSGSAASLEAIRQELKDCQARNAQAAKLALELVHEKDTLKAENVKFREQFAVELERLRDENHSLSLRLATKTDLLIQYDADLENMRSEMNAADLAEKDRMRSDYEQKMIKLRKKNDEIEKDLIESKQIMDKLTEQLADSRRELDRAKRRARLSDDSLDSSSRNRTQEQLRLDLARLNSDYETIVQEHTELTEIAHTLRFENAEFKRQLEDETSRADEFQSLSSQFRKENEELRERVALMSGELETARGSQKTARKGNSMFAELDDHRRLMERNIITLKEDNERLMGRNAELEREIQVQQQHLMVALQVTEGSGGTSRAVMEELTRLRGENRALTARLSQRMPSLNALSNDESAGALLADTDRLSKDMIVSLRMENERLRKQMLNVTTERDRALDENVSEKQRYRLLQNKLTVSENECQNLRRRVNTSQPPAKYTSQASTSGRVEFITPVLADVATKTAAMNLNEAKSVLAEQQQETEETWAAPRRQNSKKVVRFDAAEDMVAEASSDFAVDSKENSAVVGERRRRGGKVIDRVKRVPDANDLDTSAGDCKQQ